MVEFRSHVLAFPVDKPSPPDTTLEIMFFDMLRLCWKQRKLLTAVNAHLAIIGRLQGKRVTAIRHMRCKVG